MSKKSGTAAEFVLTTLRKHAENELQVADLHDECQERFTKGNLMNTLARLLQDGLVERTTDADRSAWWAIAPGALQQPPARKAEVRPAQKPAKQKAAPKVHKPAPKAIQAKPAPKQPPVAPKTPVSETDAAKRFVLDTLAVIGKPLSLLEFLSLRKQGDKHVSMRTLKLATFYLMHEGKLTQLGSGENTAWAQK
jgi:hypothetical protein